MTRSPLALLALLTACGNVTADDAPDAAGDDTTPPAIASSTPADGATRVSILAPLEIVVDEPLDPGTVTTDTVYLTNYSGSVRQPVDVTYDDGERRITIQPRRPLPYGYQVIHIEGIADPSGNPLATTLALSTFWNSTRQYTAYAGDQISSRVTSDLTEDGLLELQTSLSGPGPDLDWGTSDDVISQLSDYDFVAPTGRYDGVTTHTASGADAQWGTADDAIGTFDRLHYEGPVFTETVSYSGPGVDGMPDTADDVVANRSVYEYGDDVLADRTTIYDGSGDVSYYVDQTRNAQGQVVSYRFYTDAGPDLAWHTADDLIGSSDETTYSADGYRAVRHGGYGADGVWATADDVINYYVDYATADDGRVLSWARVTAAGVDGIWQTADDTIDVRSVYEFDANELLVGNVGYYGADDDDVFQYSTFAYDEQGNRELYRQYGGVGADGTWFTADDVRQAELAYETDL